MISDPWNGCNFPRPRSFKVQFMVKVPLTPSNAPAKFCSNNKDRFGEKCKNLISGLKMATISRGQVRLRSNSRTRCLLHLAMSHQFSSQKGCLRSNSQKKVPHTHSNVSTKFHWNNRKRLGEKSDFRPLKWPPIPKVKVVWGQIYRQGAPYP